MVPVRLAGSLHYSIHVLLELPHLLVVAFFCEPSKNILALK